MIDPDPLEPLRIPWWEQVFLAVAVKWGQLVRWIRGR